MEYSFPLREFYINTDEVEQLKPNDVYDSVVNYIIVLHKKLSALIPLSDRINLRDTAAGAITTERRWLVLENFAPEMWKSRPPNCNRNTCHDLQVSKLLRTSQITTYQFYNQPVRIDCIVAIFVFNGNKVCVGSLQVRNNEVFWN